MKKTYLFLTLVAALFSVHVNAQTCTPDPTVLNDPGIHPDSATNFVSGTVGQPYSQNITVVVPQDTQVLPPPLPAIPFDSIRMTGISNLPPGLTYMCAGTSNPTSLCTWLGNTNGCAAIYGTPTTAGTYSLVISVDAFVGGSTVANSFTVTYYKITINPAVGIGENANVNFDVKQNAPNPFTNKTNVRFTLPSEDKVKFTVYNMLGKLVMEKKIDGIKGENELEIDGKNFSGGMYFYSVEFKGKTVTRRMMVTNN
jgi:hypothetical protein